MRFDLSALKAEVGTLVTGRYAASVYRAQGYAQHTDDENVIARAHAIHSLFTSHKKILYAKK